MLLRYVLDDRPSRTSRTLEDKDNNFRRIVKFPLFTGVLEYPRGQKKFSYFYLHANILMSAYFLPQLQLTQLLQLNIFNFP